MVLIIAEAGVNHNGDLNLAKKLVEKAAEAGANYIKFQNFHSESLATASAELAEYQKFSQPQVKTQQAMLKSLELNKTDLQELIKHAKKYNISFLSTAFDIDSLNMLSSFNPKIYKIPSGEINNFQYLTHIGSLAEKLILSTGMSTMQEVASALDVLISSGMNKDDITILHCNTAYPTPISDVNLKAMLTIKKEFNVSVGYSDHTLGIEIPIAAVALGAKVIEKHITLDRTMQGPDHQASLEPIEFKNMVSSIRNIEMAMGDGVKKPSQSEKPNILIARRSLVAARRISKGSIFQNEDITSKRPANGINPMSINKVIGTKAVKDFEPDDLIEV